MTLYAISYFSAPPPVVTSTWQGKGNVEQTTKVGREGDGGGVTSKYRDPSVRYHIT